MSDRSTASKTYDEPMPLSLVDQVITDNGLADARMAYRTSSKRGIQ